jgi:Xaa-Pro aminopeptidase
LLFLEWYSLKVQRDKKDSIARKPLWLEGKDYAHGTGHGVGCFLSVHEGPVSISRNSNCVIENGMVISNEPGYYLPGKYGIRIENLEVVTKKKFYHDINNFLCFKNITRVPIDLKLIDKNLLNKNELNWVNNYHKKVYKDLSKKINKNDKDLLEFLKLKTVDI